MADRSWNLWIVLVVLVFWYVLRSIWLKVSHARRARQWGCKPAFVRPYRLPLGIDILKRYVDVLNANESQNDDWALFEELGRRNTWYQQILGSWHHYTSDPQNIQALLATQFKDFELGPVRRGSMEPLFGSGIFTADGEQWEHSRAMLRPQFVRSQVSDLELEERHLQVLFDKIPTRPDSWTDSVDLSPLFFHLTLDSASEFLMGESVNSQTQHDLDTSGQVSPAEKSKRRDWSSFGRQFDEANVGALYRFRLGDLYYLYNTKSFQKNCQEVKKCVDYFVDLALSGKVIKSKTNSYVFLNEAAKVTRDPIELRSQVLHILLAGRDTTAGLLGFTFHFLARHPLVFGKLRKTILDRFGTGTEKISFESLKACTYLQHVMAEVLRVEPIVPENARRSVRHTTLPRGGGPDGQSPIYIPAGQEVLYNVRIMHRRKDIWGEDADEFNPDRWQGRKVGWEYLPFNGGPRICIGQQFALTEAGYVIVRMLQRYDKIESLDDTPQKHRFTLVIAPVEVRVRLHEATY